MLCGDCYDNDMIFDDGKLKLHALQLCTGLKSRKIRCPNIIGENGKNAEIAEGRIVMEHDHKPEPVLSTVTGTTPEAEHEIEPGKIPEPAEAKEEPSQERDRMKLKMNARW